MQISAKPPGKFSSSLLFLFVCIVFLVEYAVTFKGFNGTDDMHYSMLAARLLQHRFNPFVPADVFCGRVGVIVVQAAIYGVGGINLLSTQAGTLLCTIACCWLAIFKMSESVHPAKTVLTAVMFFFAPTLVPAIRGVMPDAYIMFFLVLLFLFWRKIFTLTGRKKRMTLSALFGTLVAVALLFKESAILFIPFFVFLSIKVNRTAGWRFIFPMLTAAACTVCLFGFVYYKYAGDFFFRATQIHNSQLIESQSLGSCNCWLDTPHLVARLTFGPWKAFILQGFLPVLMPVCYLLLRCITRTTNRFSFSLTETAFLTLLFIILYFPANFQQYQPVCSDARQYLMLMPFGILVTAEPVYALFALPPRKNDARWLIPASAALLFCLILCLSPNKWKWLTYGCWLAGLLLPLLAGIGRPLLLSFGLLLLMAVTGLERLFFFTSPWFDNLRALQTEAGDSPAFFPEHDNYIHWQFLCGYTNGSIYNIEPDPPTVLQLYYPRPVSFKPGWFILDRAYTVRPKRFIDEVDRLDKDHFFSARKTIGDVSAYRIDTPFQLEKLKMLISP